MNQDRSELLFYTLAVLITTTLIAACFPLLKVTNNWAGNALMFIPGLIAVVLHLRRGTLSSVGWDAGPPSYWFWACLLPIIGLIMSLPIAIRLGYATVGPLLSAPGGAFGHLPRILRNVGLYTAISIPFAFGEELGWRGYAQGKLVKEFGLERGLLLLGIIWGVWHTPIYYFQGAFQEHPILGTFVMTPIDNILVVIPMGWLYIRSGNIWVPTLAHAFGDVLWGFSDILFPKNHEIGSWLILQAAQLIISIVLLIDLRSRSNDPSQRSLQASAVSP
jgi:membrane protease YdiL (CAAX protease family)